MNPSEEVVNEVSVVEENRKDETNNNSELNLNRPTSRNQSSENAIEALKKIQDMQKFEMEARATVKALLAEKGESYIQNMLQAEIQKVKKKESELAAAKKKVSAINKEIEELQMDIKRGMETKAEGERLCKVLQNDMKKRAAIAEEATKKMEEHRAEVRQKVQDNIRDIRAKCDLRKEKISEIEAENAQLREEVAKQKKDFDEAYTSYQEGWKSRESYVEELMQSYKTINREVELLEARLALARRERQVTEEGKIILKKQIEAYEAQFQQFEGNNSIESINKKAIEQREQGEARIAQLEIDKKEAAQLKIKFDKETAEWRAAHDAAKRELIKAEKAKMAAEKQCRIAQEKIKQKTKE